MTKKLGEEEIVAASYVVNFYKEVGALTNAYANYLNVILEFESKYPDDPEFLDKMPQEHKNHLIQQVQLVRFYAHKSYIQYKCMIQFLDKKGKDEELKDMEKKYLKLKTFIIKKEDIEEFTVAMNSAIITSVMKRLLETGQEILDKIYSE